MVNGGRDKATARLKGTRRAIYLHFRSRADLLVALMAHIDEELDLAGSLRPVLEAPDALSALREWTRHLARYHPRILAVVRAVDRARRTDADAAALWEHAMGAWHQACHTLAEALSREGLLADPWTVDGAADLLWALMSARLLKDLTERRGWSAERYAEGLFDLLVGGLTGKGSRGKKASPVEDRRGLQVPRAPS
jgi:AcrR family transcriptional regulator